MDQSIKTDKISDVCTGECPCGCGEPSYGYTCAGLDGYVDAAPACAVRHLTAELARQRADVPDEEFEWGGEPAKNAGAAPC